MGSVRIQPSGGWRPATGTQAGTGLGPLHAIVDYAHELADAQHKVLDRIANLGVRARLGDVYRRFVRALASFERALAKAGWAPSGIHADRLDVRLREIVGIDGVGADLGLLAELDQRAAVLLARIGELRDQPVPEAISDALSTLAELARDIRAEYEALSI